MPLGRDDEEPPGPSTQITPALLSARQPSPTLPCVTARPPRLRPSYAVAPSVSSEAAAAASKLVLLLDGVLPERDLGLQLEAVGRVVLRGLQPPVQPAADREFQDRPQGNGREGRLAVVDAITDHD